MGTWGTGLFSDDEACDLRDDYRDYLGEGLSGEEATNRLIKEYGIDKREPWGDTVFWLALSSVQWMAGRLEERVLQRALEIIDSGEDLKRWEENDKQSIRKRKEVLQKLKNKITSPQPKPKKYKKRYKGKVDWDIGDILKYQMKSGEFVLFRLVGIHKDKGGEFPIFEMFNWFGKSSSERVKYQNLEIFPNQFMVLGWSEKELPNERISVFKRKTKTSTKPFQPWWCSWDNIDEKLKKRIIR